MYVIDQDTCVNYIRNNPYVNYIQTKSIYNVECITYEMIRI